MASDLITSNSSASHILQLTELLEQIEVLSGLQLCIKNFHHPTTKRSILEEMPYRFHLHNTAFCMHIKSLHLERCMHCDLRQVPQLAMQKHRPFINRCHAQASEIIIPLIVRDQLVALGYLGQFRESVHQPSALPWLSPERIKAIMAMGILLQRFFLYEIERAASTRAESNYRHTQILRFLRRTIKDDPTLNDLAQELKLSPSRAGHLVKEITGQTFVELKMQLRLETAKEMLTGTMLTIANIAAATGFHDERYFYRVFRKATGESPGEWRDQRKDAEWSA